MELIPDCKALSHHTDVRSSIAPERQKADRVHETGDYRHSEQSVNHGLFSRWTVRHEQPADRVPRNVRGSVPLLR